MARIEEEKKVVEQMIRLYCRHKEGNRQLCPQCTEMLTYARHRLERCQFGNEKSTCKNCPIHCYNPTMKKKIAEIMRWTGPRMLLYHPLAAIRHIIRENN